MGRLFSLMSADQLDDAPSEASPRESLEICALARPEPSGASLGRTLSCIPLGGPEPVSTEASPRGTPSPLNHPVGAQLVSTEASFRGTASPLRKPVGSTEASPRGTPSSLGKPVGAELVSTDVSPLLPAAVGTHELGSLPCGRQLARHISIASSDGGPPENGVPMPEEPPNLQQSLQLAALEAAKGNPPKPFDQHALSKKKRKGEG